MAEYRAYVLVEKDVTGRTSKAYTLTSDAFFSGTWVGETFDELISDYRNSKKKVGPHDVIGVSTAIRFGVDKQGGEWWNKPLSPEEMEQLSKEVATKLRGK